jgi:hypothetical protein
MELLRVYCMNINNYPTQSGYRFPATVQLDCENIYQNASVWNAGWSVAPGNTPFPEPYWFSDDPNYPTDPRWYPQNVTDPATGHVDYSYGCNSYLTSAKNEVMQQLALCGISDAPSELPNWELYARAQLSIAGSCFYSPLVLDLDGDGVHMTSLASGVAFDLLATGAPVRTAWITKGDAWLALDRNGNGVIDSSAELFGEHQAANGFAALAELDANGDGVVDARDPVYAELVVWRDANANGVSDPGELVSLEAAGVRSIALAATEVKGAAAFDPHGNWIPLVGSFTRSDGTAGEIVDAYVRYAR